MSLRSSGVSAESVRSISTPDKVESRQGKENNWLQTVPGKGWRTILRLYNPEQAFFDKTWRPSEIEPI